jgi:tetratricopeptide (TPR) repeat protein
MARRLNTRLLVYIVIFVGVPLVVLVIAFMGGVFSRGDPTRYLAEAKVAAERQDWPQAWVAIRNAMKSGGGKDPDNQFLLAQIAMHQNPAAVAVAMQADRAALALKPTHLDAQRHLAELCLAVHFWKEAQREVDRLIALDPTYGKAYLWAAVVQMSMAEAEPIQAKKMPFYQEAVAQCKAGIEKNPDTMDLYRVLAQAYEKMGQSDKILPSFDLAITKNPTLPDGYIMKAARLMMLEKTDEAIDVLKKGIGKVGENPKLYIALGEAALRNRRAEAAREFLAKALVMDPKNESGYLRLSAMYRMDNDREKALAVVAQGLAQLPESMALKSEQTDVYLEMGNFKAAEEQMAEIARTAPDSAVLFYLRGKRALVNHQVHEAIQYLEQARAKQPSPPTRLVLARAYLAADELGAAERELDALVNDQSDLIPAWRTLAEVRFRLRDLDRASIAARRVLEANPTDTDMRMLLAQTLVLRQRVADGLKEAQTAADRDKENIDPLLLMADIYQQTQRPAEAEAMYRRALAINKQSARIYVRFAQFLKVTSQGDKLRAVLEDAKKVLTPDEYALLTGSQEELEQLLKDKVEKGTATAAEMAALARVYQVTDRVDQAKDLLRKALAKATPQSNEWQQAWQQLFSLELATESCDKAYDLIQQLKKVDPQATEVDLADAVLAMSQKNFPKAAEQLRAVTQSHKTLSQGYYLLGQVLMQMRQWEEAAGALSKALELRPQMLTARLLLGRIYYAQGNFTGAIQEAAEALKYDARFVPALELRALANAGRGDWNAACAAREDIAKLLPKHVGNLISLAALYLQRHQSEKAEEVFRRAYDLAPDNTLIVRGLADFYAETNRARLGEKIVDDYVSRHKDDSSAYVIRGEFTAKAKGPAEAEKYFRRAAEMAPNDPAPLVFLGDQYTRTGELDAAAVIYKQAIERAGGGKDVVAKRRLADTFMLQGKLGEAKTIVDDVLRANPKDVAGLVVAGRIASRQDKVDDARRYFEAALALEPNYGEAKVRLAELYAGPDPLKALQILSQIDPSDPAFEKGMLLRADINSRRVLLTEAILDLRRLLDFRPTSVPGRLALAGKYMAIRDPARATEILQQLSKERLNQDADVLVFLGDTLMVQERYADALPNYEKARALKPESTEALVGEARCLVSLKRTNDAIERIHRVMDAYPNEVWPRTALAAVYDRSGEIAKAFETLRTGLMRKEDWEAGYVLLADLLMRNKQLEEARQVLMVGLTKVPKSIPLRGGVAMIDVGAQRYDSACKILQPLAEEFQARYSRAPEKLDLLRPYFVPIRIYSLALYNLSRHEESLKWGMMLWSLEPTDVANANNMAWILATAYRDYPRASEMIAQCTRLVPNQPQVLDTAGWIAFLSGKYTEAADYLMASVKHGDNAEAHYHLARLYEATERPDEARTEYQKALKIGLSLRDKEDAQKRLGKLGGA